MKLIKYWDGGWYTALLVKVGRKYCYIIPIDPGGLSLKRISLVDMESFKYLDDKDAIFKFNALGHKYGMTKAVQRYLEVNSA